MTPKASVSSAVAALALGLLGLTATSCVVDEKPRQRLQLAPHPTRALLADEMRADEERASQAAGARGGAASEDEQQTFGEQVRERAPAGSQRDLERALLGPRSTRRERSVDTVSIGMLAPEQRLERAQIALRDDDPRTAIEALHAYLATVPTDHSARIDLARAYLLDGRDVLAREVLVSLLGEDVDQGIVLTLLGHVYVRDGRLDDAAELYEEAVTLGVDRAMIAPLLQRIAER